MKYDVVVCTYNGENYIREQLTSILSQSILPEHVIIGDDGSTDKTLEICVETLRSSGIKYTISVNSTNLGYAKNFMKHARMCNSPIIFFSDQDDVWKQDKIYVSSAYINHNIDGLLFFSDATITDNNLQHLNLTLWEISSTPALSKIGFYDELHVRYFVTGATMAIRKSLLKDCPDPPGDVPHDAWLSIVASLRGVIIPIPKKLILYRQHDANQLGAKKRTVYEKLARVRNSERIQLRKRLLKQRIFILKTLLKMNLLGQREVQTRLEFYSLVERTINRHPLDRLKLILYIKFYLKWDIGLKALILDLVI